MIRITIERKTTQQWTEQVNQVVEETPTEYTEAESAYGGSTKMKVVMARKYQLADILRHREEVTTLLVQEIADEDAFDLKAVISAINGIDATRGEVRDGL